MNDNGGYTTEFYNAVEPEARTSAEVFVGYLASLWTPQSVIDVGCGRGVWLAEWAKHGVKDLWGVDGDWVKHSDMPDPRIRFRQVDLTQRLPIALPNDAKFDLAMSLEVAEHLPESAADTFVDTLCGLSDAVLFSAAFIGQAGEHHVNCQLHSYWAAKFAERGYKCYDLFRPRFWDDNRVAPWYRANTFLYIYPRHPLISTLHKRHYCWPLENLAWCDAVHPWLYLNALAELVKQA